MDSGYESVKNCHRLLFALVEMRDLEELIAKETSDASKRIWMHQAKMIFERLSRESSGHHLILQGVIDKQGGMTPDGRCKVCNDNIIENSRRRVQMLELYNLIRKHHLTEGDAERRYADMAEMTDNQEIKEVLADLSKEEKKHHSEIQEIISLIEQSYKTQGISSC